MDLYPIAVQDHMDFRTNQYFRRCRPLDGLLMAADRARRDGKKTVGSELDRENSQPARRRIDRRRARILTL
jgi:hypothetical protein